ncbi:MAG: HNH endonuclease [bacterium]
MNAPVLVLNGDYQPLNITDLRRAVGLVLLGKAAVLEHRSLEIGTATFRFPAPSVIKLEQFVRRPYLPVRLTRRALFARDGYCCQYCGSGERQLTIDHVVPRTKGGGHTWDNLVTACKRCNNLKGGRTVEQSGFRLRRAPSQPSFILSNHYPSIVNQTIEEAWLKYLAIYLPRQ